MAGWYERRLFFTKYIFRIWYKFVNRVDRKGELVFMNYGFSNGEPTPDLEPNEESNRTCIQLYDQLVKNSEIKDKHILEVGSGRGGGLAFLTQRYKPKMATGLDLNKTAISFCNKTHAHKGLKFHHGHAEKLPFEDNSMDIVINVESSHRYENMHAFLAEVKRVLRPGGSFLLTDFRYDHHLEKFKRDIQAAGMNIINNSLITSFVVEALKNDNSRRVELVKRLVPWFLHKHALEFSGVVGSRSYNNFESGRWSYLNYHLKKEM